jgi:hypothetical protein
MRLASARQTRVGEIRGSRRRSADRPARRGGRRRGAADPASRLGDRPTVALFRSASTAAYARPVRGNTSRGRDTRLVVRDLHRLPELRAALRAGRCRPHRPRRVGRGVRQHRVDRAELVRRCLRERGRTEAGSALPFPAPRAASPQSPR